MFKIGVDYRVIIKTPKAIEHYPMGSKRVPSADILTDICSFSFLDDSLSDPGRRDLKVVCLGSRCPAGW